MISREKLLSQTTTRYIEKVVFGETYRMRSLTERERAEYEIKLQDKKAGMSLNKARSLLICRVLVDEQNNRLLTDDDSELVGAIDGRIASALYSVALDHNGFAEDDVKDLVKNSV
jgi:hypothetical protein